MNKLLKYSKNWYHLLKPSGQNLFLEYKVDFKPRYGHGNLAHSQLYSLINADRERYYRMLQRCLSYSIPLLEIKDAEVEKDPVLPVWNSGYLPGLDILATYTILAENRPKKYIEVGSGTSTKVAYKVKNDQKIDMQIVSIDPMPRTEISAIANQVIKKPFEMVDFFSVFDLEENDVLFIDNSHRILPNSDSMVFFLEVLPRLRPGVIVHIHDVYLPYDYPQDMCDRFYNEQYGLAIWLLSNPERSEILMPNYFISEDPQLSQVLNNFWEKPELGKIEKHGGSFWFKVK